MKRLQTKLGTLREEATGGRVEGIGGQSSFAASDLGDLGSHEFEEDVTLGLADNQQHLMEEIDAALARLEDGSFGHCEQCGEGIPKERLRALPYCRFCMACAAQRETAP